jgi:hypothetical protein
VPDLRAATFGSVPLASRVMAARRPRVEAFEVSPVYLMDTGSGHDIVSHDLANAHAQFVNKAKRMSFSTANGESRQPLYAANEGGCVGGHINTIRPPRFPTAPLSRGTL